MTFRTKLLFALLAAAVVHGIYNFLIPLHPDEAYYWLWSVYPDWSYFDHPAMIAWMIKALSFLGDSEGAVRATTVLCMSGACYALSMLSYRIGGERAGWILFIAFSVLPAAAMGYAFVTPDSPLMLFWCFALYWGYLAISGEGNRYFILTGVAIALMIVSKYTAVLFIGSLFIYMLVFDRKLFKNKYMWLAAIIGACGVIPIVIWNMQNDWISIKFQYTHGTSDSFKILWDEWLLLLGGIQLLPTPIFAFIMYKASFYFKGYRREQWFKFLLTLFLVPIVFFLYKGLFKKMELNWPIIGFLAAFPMMAVYIAAGYHKRLFKAGAIFAGVLTVILLVSPFLPLPDSINISLRLKGNKEAVEELKSVMVVDNDTKFFSDYLINASIMTYYLDGHPRVYVPVGARFNQFNLWDNGTDYSTMKGYYMGAWNKGKQKELLKAFGKIEFIKKFKTGNPLKPKELHIYRVGE
ncbi:MAG: glycosyltransferase family 39 protein [Deferribacteraceae bacterium]|jgi:4-amino-4-deoxy-L-arabinose transferase-like glycosyltransferase|nr:glycosyltransferase family 39 protein [Deferribacteraceae bacterium]